MDSSTTERHFVVGLWGVRYQVRDVQRSILFYTHTLGFNLDRQTLPAFGQVSMGVLNLILSGPGASGSRPMPDGGLQDPGGWNRVVLRVKALPALVTELENQGVRFRNEMEVGPGGKQIQVEDPDGNPIVVRAYLAVGSGRPFGESRVKPCPAVPRNNRLERTVRCATRCGPAASSAT